MTINDILVATNEFNSISKLEDRIRSLNPSIYQGANLPNEILSFSFLPLIARNKERYLSLFLEFRSMENEDFFARAQYIIGSNSEIFNWGRYFRGNGQNNYAVASGQINRYRYIHPENINSETLRNFVDILPENFYMRTDVSKDNKSNNLYAEILYSDGTFDLGMERDILEQLSVKISDNKH